jgi:hypothetical protein
MSDDMQRRRAASRHFGFDAYDERPGPLDTPCWIFHGKPNKKSGYCQMRVLGVLDMAHRAFYEHYKAAIPAGLTLDHLCRVRNCVNPTHLEPCTRGENTLRGRTITAANRAKVACLRGHEFTPENTYMVPNGGGRACRACACIRTREYKERKQAA